MKINQDIRDEVAKMEAGMAEKSAGFLEEGDKPYVNAANDKSFLLSS